ncbi:MAG: 30S ribosomal protein S20 [Cytophagales bacterium]|nr:30S ribosomal protein S20 [Armatimonadota bacterium]
MPNIKSVKKDVLRSRKNHLRNQATKSRIKTFMKKTNTAIAGSDTGLADLLSQTISVLDKAAKRGIIHKNAAARRKSRLMSRAAKVTVAAA